VSADNSHVASGESFAGSRINRASNGIKSLGDDVVVADEIYQHPGEKGVPHDDSEDPPRRRANSPRGHGTFATDLILGKTTDPR
jgi:hypothetical protein